MNRFNGSAPVGKYIVESWFERDRSAVWVSDNETGDTISEWLDDDCVSMFDYGFFDNRNLEQSVLDYCLKIGIIKE